MSQQSQAQWTLGNTLTPLLLIASLSGIGILRITESLESKRPQPAAIERLPPRPVGSKALQTEFSRLWQDPLSGVEKPFSQRDAGSPNEKEWKSSLEDIAAHFKSRFDAAMEAAGSPPRNRPTVLCLPVLVPGKPYVETREQRRRTRYAVLSALGTDFELAYPERMSSLTVPLTVQIGPKPEHNQPIEITVPLKLYRHRSLTQNSNALNSDGDVDKDVDEDKKPPETPYKNVFVLWINQSQIGVDPMFAVAQILEHIFATVENTKKQCDLAIIGPSDSGAFETILKKNRQKTSFKIDALRAAMATYRCGSDLNESLSKLNGNCRTYFKKRFRQARLYSSRATITIESSSYQDGSQTGLQVIRTIGDDSQLAKTIINELSLRNAWTHEFLTFRRRKHIVLIGEKDTTYAQAFRHAFIDAAKQKNANLKPTETPDLHFFSYLRGIDGQYPKSDRLEDKPNNGYQDTELIDASLPHGSGQFDYLRRLEEELIDLNERLRTKGEGRIAAIGLIGTDVYDKLLLLTALRPHFPHVKFFTTDMDARLSHATEYLQTKNLLIVSHYDLFLHRDFTNNRLGPFRDSYQTATHLAAHLAIYNGFEPGSSKNENQKTSFKQGFFKNPWGVNPGDQPSKCKQRLVPLVFEIGRQGAVRLTPDSISQPNLSDSKKFSVHPPARGSAVKNRQLFLALGGTAILASVILMLFTYINIHKPSAAIFEQANGPRGQPSAATAATGTRANALLALSAVAYAFAGICVGIAFNIFTAIGFFFSSAPLLMIVFYLREGVAGKNTGRIQNGFLKTIAAYVRFPWALVGGCIFLFVFFGIATWSHFNEDGQVFEWQSGLSVWPPALLRVGISVVSIGALFYGVRKVVESRYGEQALKSDQQGNHPVDDDFASKFLSKLGVPSLPGNRSDAKSASEGSEGFESSSGSGSFSLGTSNFFRSFRNLVWFEKQRGLRLSSQQSSTEQLVDAFRESTAGWSLLARAIVWFSLLIPIYLWLVYFAGYPVFSHRGSQVFLCVVTSVLLLSHSLVLLVTVFTVDALVQCIKVARRLSRTRQSWMGEGRQFDSEENDEIRTIEFLALQSRVVTNLLWWPVVLATLLLFTHHRWIDAYELSYPQIGLLLIPIVAVIAAGWILRSVCDKAREQVLERLGNLKLTLLNKPAGDRARRVDQIIQAVKNESRGAFRPLSSDPLVGALTVPSVGYALVSVAERVS